MKQALMSHPFDIYLNEDSKIVIVTIHHEQGEKIITENIVTLKRAKEILDDLKDAITYCKP